MSLGEIMLKKMIIYTFLIGICLISLQSINAADIKVHPGESIQSAVNKASSGDTVIVFDNNKKAYTYKESVVINKKIHLKASGKVTIESKNRVSYAISVSKGGSGSIIQDFKLTKSSYCIVLNNAKNCKIYGNRISSASLVGIQFYGNIKHTRVIGNSITGSSSVRGNGISFESGSITNNIIRGNTISNFLNGILFNRNSENNIVQNNKVFGYGFHGAGIYATDNSRRNHIIDNIVTGYEDGIAVQKLGSGTATRYKISGNTVKGNKNGLWVRLSLSTIKYNTAIQNKVSGMDITGSNNYIASNVATKNGICGIALGRCTKADHNIVTKNTLTYNIAGINSASHYTTISNNYVCYNKNYGIISTANHTTITGNTIKNNGSRILVKRKQ